MHLQKWIFPSKNISHHMAGIFQQSDTLEEYTFSKSTQERLTDIFTILSKSEDKAEKLFKDYDEDKLKKAPAFLNQSYIFPELYLEYYMNKKSDRGCFRILTNILEHLFFQLMKKLFLKEYL